MVAELAEIDMDSSELTMLKAKAVVQAPVNEKNVRRRNYGGKVCAMPSLCRDQVDVASAARKWITLCSFTVELLLIYSARLFT